MIWLIDFISRTFGSGKDTTANILVTISTFLAGILISVIFNAIKKYKERKNHRKLIKLNLALLRREIFRQATGYEKLYEQLVVDFNGAFTFIQQSISTVGIFYSLEYKNCYNAFFGGLENFRFSNKKKIRAFNNLWATLEFLTVFHKSSFDDVKEFIAANKEANELRNSSLGRAHEIVERIRFTLHGEAIPENLGNYFKSIETIFENLHALPNYDNPKIINDYFVDQLLELNRDLKNIDLLKVYFEYLHPVELNSALLNSSIRYINQKNLLQSYHDYFEGLNKSFLNQYRKIGESQRILFNYWWSKPLIKLKLFIVLTYRRNKVKVLDFGLTVRKSEA